MAIASFPYLESKNHSLFKRDLSRAGNDFCRLGPYSFGSKLLVGGAAFRDRICELSVYFDHQRHAVCPALRYFHIPYKFIPYTKVRLSSALVGGAVAGLLWQVVGMAFAAFVANSARYEAVYSSFAIVIVFLIWLYTGWLIFLIGAEVTYFHQYPSAFLYEAMTDGKGYRFQEWLALSALAEIARRHLSHRPPWEQTELAARLGASSLGNLIGEFVRSGILLKSAEPEGVALARPPENIFVKEIIEIVGGSTMHERGAIADVLLRRDQAAQKALEGITLKSLVQENSATILQFPYVESATTTATGIKLQKPPNGD